MSGPEAEFPSQKHQLDRAKFGVFEVDLDSGELRKFGTRVKLQQQPFELLIALLEKPGQLVTREELRARLWPEDVYVSFDDSLNRSINKLRSVLGDQADSPRFIETIPRRGYNLSLPSPCRQLLRRRCRRWMNQGIRQRPRLQTWAKIRRNLLIPGLHCGM